GRGLRRGTGGVRRGGRQGVLVGRRIARRAGQRSRPVLAEGSASMARARKRKTGGHEPQRRRPGGKPIIELRDVTKVYPGGHMALDRVSLAVDRGEFVFLVGPTGCGKSTLIKTLIRDESATDRAGRIAGRDI